MERPSWVKSQKKPKIITTTKVLEKVEYKPFTHFGRTLHIDNCVESYKAKKLLVYGLNKKDNTKLKDEKINIVWFKTDQDAEKQDWYGNICFTIAFKELLHHFGGITNLYYVEEVEFTAKSYSRILLTKKDAKHLPSQVAKINVTKIGSPILQDKNGDFQYVSKCKRKDGYMSPYHGIELMVDATVPDLIWLYKYCAKKAVNHSECNRSGSGDRKFALGMCRKFNTMKLECPYCLSVEETEHFLEENCPGFIESGVPSNLPDINKLSIN